VKHSGKSGPVQLELPFGAALDEEVAPPAAPEPSATDRKKSERRAAAAPAAEAEAAPPSPPRSSLRLIQGGGRRTHEPLSSRDAVVRVLIEAGADLLLRRITPERAEHIEHSVNQILDLFDRVDTVPQLMPVLQRQLDELEALMTETRAQRSRRPG
jgi:hypothetical protein